MTLKAGDYFYTKGQDDDGEDLYTVFRCLKRDEEFGVVHVALLEPTEHVPTANDIDALGVHTAHLPIDQDGFDDPVVFANRAVKKEELDGYFTYLRQADFEAFLQESGADVDALAKDAEELFEKATALAEAEQYEEAAEYYYQAFEAFPLYYEAIDNAGLCLLDAERYEDALSCFEESIEVNGNTFMTDYSIAECYHAMDRLDEAEDWYRKAAATPDITPEQKEAVEAILSAE